MLYASGDSQLGEAHTVPAPVVYSFIYYVVSPVLQEGRLPTLVVRCVEHLMK